MAIEILPAHLYLMTSYYERWFLRLETCASKQAW